MNDELWTKRDGTTIKVSEMTEDHLRRTVKMVSNNRRFDLVVDEMSVEMCRGWLCDYLKTKRELVESIDALMFALLEVTGEVAYA